MQETAASGKKVEGLETKIWELERSLVEARKTEASLRREIEAHIHDAGPSKAEYEALGSQFKSEVLLRKKVEAEVDFLRQKMELQLTACVQAAGVASHTSLGLAPTSAPSQEQVKLTEDEVTLIQAEAAKVRSLQLQVSSCVLHFVSSLCPQSNRPPVLRRRFIQASLCQAH
jgi:hypothetical protein